ncbi:MAG: ATP-binding protein [Spirochaetaceae bacterium]|jgi:AAA15 family ATPase/GTPase|nr:ATP-binding protein [Spirochaetaceae bacterium]
MIAEFTVQNYRSFKERHTFSLVATKSRELLDSNTFEAGDKLRFLKTAVICGANASGKSNFFKALSFFTTFAVYSGPRKQVGDTIEVDAFYFSKQTEHEPSSFELIFFMKNDAGKNVRYRYGFSVTPKEVITEYLFAIFNVREVALFTRDKQNITTTVYFSEGGKIKSATRQNCSFLSVCAQANGEIAVSIVQYFQNMLITSGLQNNMNLTKNRFSKSNDEGTSSEVLDFLHFADIQVKKLHIERELISIAQLPPEFQAFLKSDPQARPPEQTSYFFGHTYFDNDKNIDTVLIPEHEESSGTRKLFAYAIPITSALKNGTPLFIDEFDAQLHPLILENIIKLFNSSPKNPKNAQLVISCHAINILTNKLFRRDQIWFCEKDQYGATDLYSLVEYDEPVRSDAAFGKNYLQGKYGALPYISEIALRLGDRE